MAEKAPPEATRFKAGASGNPGGRPPTKKIRKAIRHMSDAALAALGAGVAGGEQWAVTLWFAYYYGKPAEQVRLAGADGEPLQVSISINFQEKPPDAK